MPYETETKTNIPLAERIGKAAAGVGEALKGAVQFEDDRRKTQAYLDHIQSINNDAAQQFQANQAKMKDQAIQSQTGLLFTAAASNAPDKAAQMLYPRYSNFSQFTGDQSQPQELAEKAKNLQAVLTKESIQRMVQAPSLIGNVSIDPKTHQQHLATALQDLQQAEPYLSPEQSSSAKALLEKQDASYNAHRTALEASTIKVAGANERAAQKNDQTDDKRFNDVVDTLQGRKRVGASAPYQQAQQRLSLANASEAWLKAMKTGKVVPNQASIAQLKSNIDSMVAGGSGRSVEMIKILMEKTRTSDTAQALQYVTSHPQAAASKAFLTQYQNELDVEKAAWEQKRNEYLDASLADLQDIVSADTSKAKRLKGILKGIAPGYPIEERLGNLGSSSEQSAPMQAAPSALGPDEEIIKGYVVNHRTKQVIRKAE